MKFGVAAVQNGPMYMVVKSPDGKEISMTLPGLSIHNQVFLAVLQHILERKVGRYIYPRLKPTTVGDRLIGIVAEWDRTFVPKGTPPPILAVTGFAKQFAAANEGP